ncbi:Succinate dehydrogenase or fumarate reductase, flavoprotein subunit [Nitrospira sp. KM1]|uniref:fumarate reductase/succinate dehydrogenase flavoprotein subunit n=1 Tax=Nitrospira sp. KM1 TaxID=1936990 RepID=UPI0013A7A99D|nr:fumarate reductase/succinate dehydrogenase flavoprotein subunit [Nitrospira sp. KM1]BCA55168.1 Succinate dehydrogenase or fumarate reductase, flavoprotein subunit [Nitrospira sp. KM1]
MIRLDARVPEGPLESKWDRHRFSEKLVSPHNKQHIRIIVVGTGLAGASAASTLGQLGYHVECFCVQDSPRRAHSIAAQGGINAAKNYQDDGDSIQRLFYDTIKGGDFRSREANVYRLAQISAEIVDQCVALGVPFAREYGGQLANRSFGGVQVSRTFYCRGQTGQQLLLGAYSALCWQIERKQVRMHPRTEMLDLIVVDGHARGIVVRDLVSGKIGVHTAEAVVLATGGYSNVYFLSTNASSSNVTATYRAWKQGAAFANPCFTQIHPTAIPPSEEYQAKLTLMSESLRNDGRIWVPKQPSDRRVPSDIPDADRDYFLERRYPRYGNLVPRDVASRAVKVVCDEGQGVGPGGQGVFLDLSDAIAQQGLEKIRERYGNLFDMYNRITGEDAYTLPMRIYPAPHYTMGGLWVDYNLMSTVPGLFVIGEANFADHGANRLGASSLMQGLADGYFILPYTIGHYLATTKHIPLGQTHSDVRVALERATGKIERVLQGKGRRTAASFHREIGRLMWNACGMARHQAGLRQALQDIPPLREAFWRDVAVPGSGQAFNQELEYAGRVGDFLEFAELLCYDALEREESCGAHFREEYQTPDGEPIRDDQRYAHVAAWEYVPNSPPALSKEPLAFEFVKPAARSYK